jgi:predicted RNA-binding Zn ribbon-like protein
LTAFSETVEGFRLPRLLAGHASLDFCNTYTGWNGGRQHDYLLSYELLLVWAGFAGLLPPRRVRSLRREAADSPQRAGMVLARARRFRSDLYRLARNPRTNVGGETVSEEIHSAATLLELRRRDDRLALEIGDAASLAAPLTAVAWAAADLLTSRDLRLVRACPGDGCGWLFLDRRGRRRWCTMATCGNRAKARRHAARQAHRSEDLP